MSFYCLATILMPPELIEKAINELKEELAINQIDNSDIKAKATTLRGIIQGLAQESNIELKLRKKGGYKMVTKVEEVKNLVELGIKQPKAAFPKIKQLAQSDDWKAREVAATCLVEISKKKTDEVIQEMVRWADDGNPNVRRTSSEGSRAVARRSPDKVLPVIEKLNKDDNLYVKKSVANVLRNASRYNPNFVFELCQKWALLNNPNTNWIIKNAIKKLPSEQQKEILSLVKRA